MFNDQNIRPSPAAFWAGWILTALMGIFLLFDAVSKLLSLPMASAAAKQMGYSPAAMIGIGGVLLVSTLLYLVPVTAFFGALLLTAYLGGAVDAMVHAGMGWTRWWFPIIYGILIWVVLGLRDGRKRAPLKQLLCSKSMT